MKKIYCPWCGSEMIPDSNTYCPSLMCSNESCAAVAPFGHSLEEAYKVADRRVPQKPLTLDEACGSEEPCVLLEEKGCTYVWAANVRFKLKSTHKLVLMQRIGCGINFEFHAGDYGVKWRCWATKPSDEERKAAKWE